MVLADAYRTVHRGYADTVARQSCEYARVRHDRLSDSHYSDEYGEAVEGQTGTLDADGSIERIVYPEQAGAG